MQSIIFRMHGVGSMMDCLKGGKTMSFLQETIPMGTFNLDSKIESLDSIAEILTRRFEKLGYSIHKPSTGRDFRFLLSRKGIFKIVPGLHTFISVVLYEQSDLCEISLLFVKSNGLETSMIAQILTNSTIIVDPCPIPTPPRYDLMIGSLFHKSVQERNIGIFLTKGYGDKIISTINECL